MGGGGASLTSEQTNALEKAKTYFATESERKEEKVTSEISGTASSVSATTVGMFTPIRNEYAGHLVKQIGMRIQTA